MNKTEIGTCEDCIYWTGPDGICTNMKIDDYLYETSCGPAGMYWVEMTFHPRADFGCIHWAENSATKQEEE